MPVPSDHHSRKVKQERFLFFLAMAVSDKRGGGHFVVLNIYEFFLISKFCHVSYCLLHPGKTATKSYI